jgi:hypothetical protein
MRNSIATDDKLFDEAIVVSNAKKKKDLIHKS